MKDFQIRMKELQIDKEELSKIIDIPVRTLYNWEKNRPKLYNFLTNCIKKEKENKTEVEILFEELTEEEQTMYISEMKARILRRKLDK